MASIIARTMGYRQTPKEPDRPLRVMTAEGRLDESPVRKSPETLNESNLSMTKRLIPQFLILIIPACFIFLGVCIVQTGETFKSNGGEAISQAAKLSSTVWPIAFAAVVGPMVKAMALYFAERGISLGTLEVVFASQTLASTLRGCFTLRIFRLWILAIAAVWTLSPAGGQGVARALESQRTRDSSDINIQSFPMNNLSSNGGAFNLGISSSVTLYNQWNGVAVAAFSAPDARLMHLNESSDSFYQVVEQAGGPELAIQSTHTDLWKNVRVPILQLLPGYDQSRPFEWVDVPSDTIPPYESLIGIPIRGTVPHNEGNGTTTISSYYHYLSCSGWDNQTEWLLKHPTALFNTSIVNGTINPYPTMFGSPGFPNIFMALLNDTTRLNYTTTHPFAEPHDKQVLVFSASRYFQPLGYITLCEVTTSYVDSSVDCKRPADGRELSCAAKAVRHTNDRPVSGNFTAFDLPFTWQMLNEIPFILASMRPSEPGMLERFLKDPSSTFNSTGPEKWDYRDLPFEIFSARLSMLINTFFRASLDTQSLVGMKNTPLNHDTDWLNTTFSWTTFTAPKYVIKVPWFILYIVSTAVMTLCALVNIILRGMTRVPDFLGSVSALTRDSPFVAAPAGGTAMDGTERTKLLKDKWVRIQDVKPNEEVGRIAFSDAKGSGRLRMDRKYE